MRWVILNRDGVINEDSLAIIKSPEDWIAIPGSLEAIAQLHQSGFSIAVLTNQVGLGRGVLEPDGLALVHAKMHREVAQLGGHIETVLVCPHGPEDGCLCRSPKPGLFEQFAGEFQVDLRDVPVVSDNLRDMQAAENLGAEPILVETGQGQKTLRRNPNLDFQTFVNLHEAAQYILFTRR
jgi:D-glycero-D-manno-heptose 1,7-bisphosphate phosphatase